jgi:hypothetical protein
MGNSRWEYQNLIFSRRWTGKVWEGSAWLCRGAEVDQLWSGQDNAFPSSQVLMNEYGSDGWELLGPPLQNSAVVNVAGLDVAEWTLLSFWMKRELT